MLHQNYQPFFSSALQSDHRKSKFGFRSAIKLKIINELVFGGRTHTSSHSNMPRNQKVAASPPDRGGGRLPAALRSVTARAGARTSSRAKTSSRCVCGLPRPAQRGAAPLSSGAARVASDQRACTPPWRNYRCAWPATRARETRRPLAMLKI